MAAYVRKVPTKSGAQAVQIVWSKKHGHVELEHVGSAHDDTELALLWSVARQRMNAGQTELDLGLPVASSDALPIVGSRMGRLLDVIAQVYRWFGFDRISGLDKVFEQLVTARIIEPSSKKDAGRVLGEAGLEAMSYATIKRRLPSYARQEWRDRLSGAVAARAQLGPAALVLYDLTTLWFETDEGDGFREPGFSKERRLEPQVTVGLLADTSGAPLMVDAFAGNQAETTTMIPLIQRFISAYGITGVTVVADAGMLSEANLKAVEDAGWSFIVGGRIPEVPYVVKQWLNTHPGEQVPDQLTLSQPDIMGVKPDLRGRMIYYQWREDRARRSLHGIDQQIVKAEKTVAGQTPVKRNRFVKISGAIKSVNRELEAKTRTLAGWKSYVTNLDSSPEFVIGAYHQLWHVEHAFRMSKHDLKARPIYHHKKESIDAHLAVVFAALAISHWIEQTTGWTISQFVKTMRTYREVTISVDGNHVKAEQPITPEIIQILDVIHDRLGY